jgi:hypothetical protein
VSAGAALARAESMPNRQAVDVDLDGSARPYHVEWRRCGPRRAEWKRFTADGRQQLLGLGGIHGTGAAWELGVLGRTGRFEPGRVWRVPAKADR